MAAHEHVHPDQFTEAVRQHWGTNDIEGMFPEGAPKTSVPWRTAGRSKQVQDFDPDIVHKALREPRPEISHIDPRGLRATQPMVTRAGVDYYLNRERYPQTGETFADKQSASNQWPTVYRRPTMVDPTQTEDILLSGHHRATAALLQGRPLEGRLIEGPWGPARRQRG